MKSPKRLMDQHTEYVSTNKQWQHSMQYIPKAVEYAPAEQGVSCKIVWDVTVTDVVEGG